MEEDSLCPASFVQKRKCSYSRSQSVSAAFLSLRWTNTQAAHLPSGLLYTIKTGCTSKPRTTSNTSRSWLSWVRGRCCLFQEEKRWPSSWFSTCGLCTPGKGTPHTSWPHAPPMRRATARFDPHARLLHPWSTTWPDLFHIDHLRIMWIDIYGVPRICHQLSFESYSKISGLRSSTNWRYSLKEREQRWKKSRLLVICLSSRLMQ